MAARLPFSSRPQCNCVTPRAYVARLDMGRLVSDIFGPDEVCRIEILDPLNRILRVGAALTREYQRLQRGLFFGVTRVPSCGMRARPLFRDYAVPQGAKTAKCHELESLIGATDSARRMGGR